MASGVTTLIFPGQGSQRPGMLGVAPENDTLGRLLDAAEGMSGIALRKYGVSSQIDPQELQDTRVAQPLLYLTDWAWAVALLECGIEPEAVAGHSLGEFAALAISGAISVEAGLDLVVERSRLMFRAAQNSPGTMAAVIGLKASELRACIGSIEGVWVANENSYTQTVISGTDQGVEEATSRLLTHKLTRVMPLKVSGPFHSPLMETAARDFAGILENTEFRTPSIPVMLNVDPEPTTDPDVIRHRLSQQMTSPVRWSLTMELMASRAPVIAIESGPGSVLKGLARAIHGIQVISVESVGLEHVVQEVLGRDGLD